MKLYSSTTKANSHRTLRTKRIRLLIFVAGIFLVTLFAAPFVIQSISAVILSPVVYTKHWFEHSPHTLASFWRDRTALEESIASLERDLADAQKMSDNEQLLTQENETLRALIANASTSIVAASVIARPPLTPYDSLVLDVGIQEGVAVGSIVFAGDNIAIGAISGVYDKTSIVTLFSTPNIESTAYILGPNIYTTAKGVGGGVLEIGVPQGIALAVGDPVVLPALRKSILGRIHNIVSVPSEPQQFAYVSLPVAVQSLRYVRVAEAPQVPLTFAEIQQVVEGAKLSIGLIDLPEGILVDIATSSTSTTATSTDESGGEE